MLHAYTDKMKSSASARARIFESARARSIIMLTESIRKTWAKDGD